MRRAGLLDPILLGYQPSRGGGGSVRLGPVGRCPGRPVLTIGIPDDSGSVTAPGGSDPVSGRYREMGLALRAVSRACRCNQELAALVHFDTPHGDIAPQPLNRAGFAVLQTGLRVPSGGSGSSDLLPALTKAESLAKAHPEHEVVACIFSDFEFTDRGPGAVVDALERFPGRVFGCLLGRNQPQHFPGVDQVAAVSPSDPPGAVANVLLEALTAHRCGAKRGDADRLMA